ncbi:hypothetical protein ACLOJK_012098 [Asimina triloba]
MREERKKEWHTLDSRIVNNVHSRRVNIPIKKVSSSEIAPPGVLSVSSPPRRKEKRMQCTFTASRPTPRLYSMDPYSSSFSSLLSLLITLFFLNMHQPSTSSASTTPHFSKIYAFGDSYTDTGNTQSSTGPTSYAYVSNPPYGMTFFHRPTNRYSDGRLVVDFLTTNLSLPFLPPYRSRNADFSHGSNFAVAGSTAIRHEFYVENNITINTTPQSLGTELGWLEEFLVRNRRTVVEEDSLIWVGEMGANDYAYSFFSSVPRSSIQQLAIKSLTGFLQVFCSISSPFLDN